MSMRQGVRGAAGRPASPVADVELRAAVLSKETHVSLGAEVRGSRADGTTASIIIWFARSMVRFNAAGEPSIATSMFEQKMREAHRSLRRQGCIMREPVARVEVAPIPIGDGE